MEKSKLWRWETGRQGDGYSKFLIAGSKRLKFDFYILRVHKGGHVPPHKDPSQPGYDHHRINITLRKAERGGQTYFDNYDTISELPKLELAPLNYHFRPDFIEHHVTRVVMGELWLLSFGWLRKKKGV